MDYEKKYKEALSRAKAMIKVAANQDEAIGFANTIFPELQESEEERVRKSIYNYINVTLDDNQSEVKEKWLAWLEKQGEQKHSDKVVPKFKVGDWVVSDDKDVHDDYRVCKITKIDDGRYYIEGGDFLSESSLAQYEYRLWTIADAKDGDVLCLYYNSRKTFFIFKAIIGEGDYADILVHCCYTGKYQYLEPSFNGECRMHQISDGGYCVPADKEEQCILFQKMKEAGYEWDANKLELKKIDMQELVKQNPAWSEEDEENLAFIIEHISICFIDEAYIKYIDWLKSIKQRIGGQYDATKK